MGIPSNGGEQQMSIIPEGDLYRLIIKSKLPKAEKFECWVMEEVLPTIRETGGVVTDEVKFIKKYFPSFSDEVKQDMVLDLRSQNEKMRNKINEINEFINQIIASDTCILVRDLAHLITKKNIKIGEKGLWKKLREWKMISQKGTEPYQRFLEQGIFEVSQFSINTNHGVKNKRTTRITGKGQVYIIKKIMKEVI